MKKNWLKLILVCGLLLTHFNGSVFADNHDGEGTEEESGFEENLVLNGDFSDGDEFWGTWNGEGGDSTFTVAEGVAEIAIHSIAGIHPEWNIPISWSTQFFQEGIELMPSTTYELTFRAWASMERAIEVEYEGAEGSSQFVNLTTDPQEYTFSFSTLSARTLQLNFLLGNVVSEDRGTPEEAHSVYFDYVTLTKIEGEESEIPKRDWELVWSDEFDGNELDRSVWNVDIGNGQASGLEGWGNNELQYYTDNPTNIRVEDGRLIIEAHEETVTDEYGTFHYTSGKITTENHFSQTYGRFEASMKLPVGQGFWPAFWMMPQDDVYGGWAASGEIDIMENRGSETNEVGAAIHYGGEWPENTHSGGAYSFPNGQTTTDFNLYSIEWEPEEIRWYVNDDLYYVANEWFSTNGEYHAPFDQKFFMIMNLAVGGWYGGNPDDTTQFPAQMEVDYVRVYQDADLNNGDDPSDPEETEPEETEPEEAEPEEIEPEETKLEEMDPEETDPEETDLEETAQEGSQPEEPEELDDDTEFGEQLPQTATSTWTVGLLGGISVVIGTLTKFYRKK